MIYLAALVWLCLFILAHFSLLLLELSARLALPAPQEKSLEKLRNQFAFQSSSMQPLNSSHDPKIEEPASPREEECQEMSENDIEDFDEYSEISTIKLYMETFAQNLDSCIKKGNEELQIDDTSKALVAISNEAASIALPKVKDVHMLRTEHYV